MKHGLQYDPEEKAQSKPGLPNGSGSVKAKMNRSRAKVMASDFVFFFNVQDILFGDFLEAHETNICLL